MLFSIILPIYNVEKYLRECIDSVLSQSFTDYEIILVDDGSTDSSGAICDEYAQKHPFINVVHKSNSGLSEARNVGLEAALGEYIIFIDSDDYISDNDFLLDISKKIPENDLVLYKFSKFYDESGKTLPCSFTMPDISNAENLSEKIKMLVKNDAFYCAAWTKCIRKTILTENKIYFESGLLSEDQEWYFHILSVIKNVDAVDKSYIMYRQRQGSISHSFRIKNLDDCIYILKKWSEYYLSKKDTDISDGCLNALGKLYCNLLTGYVALKDKAKKSRYDELKDLKFLLNYNLNPRTKMFSRIADAFGLKGLLLILKVLIAVK